MRHPILSRVPLVFLGTCFRWAVTKYSTSSQTVVNGLLCREIGSMPWHWI